MDKPKIKGETLQKILYSDNVDSHQRMYLNINLLRELKIYLIQNMTNKEKGCVNLYHLENYLIERALDPQTEENYKDYDELVKDTLNYLRSRPDYWITNSEVYLEIISKSGGDLYHDSTYVNKDLTAIYNYIYNNQFKTLTVKESVSARGEDDVDIFPTNYIDNVNVNENVNVNVNSTINSGEYCNFIQFLESDNYLDIDKSLRMLFDVTILPQIYQFILLNYSSTTSREDFQFKIQNFLLFFSHVSYSKEISYLWGCESEPTVAINSNLKKYSLRVATMNEEELDNIFIETHIKFFNLQDEANRVKSLENVKEFLGFIRDTYQREAIFKEENMNMNIGMSIDNGSKKFETNLKHVIAGYTLLHNILLIFDAYVKIHSTVSPDSVLDYKKLFETYKLLPRLYKVIYDPHSNMDEINSIAMLYINLIEQRKNYAGCINLLRKYKSSTSKFFGAVLDEDKLNGMVNNYVHNYYNSNENKIKRIYKTENAGINWTEDDMKKFHDGLKLFGHCQLANTKIAKFMGHHIEASHVKLFRSQIFRERRLKRKVEKSIKISEMKKNRNSNWKEAKNMQEEVKEIREEYQ